MKTKQQSTAKRSRRAFALAVLALLVLVGAGFSSLALGSPGEAPRLSPRIDQAALQSMPLLQARTEGRRMFTTPFNVLDGLGDGAIGQQDKISPGGRPTMGDNGQFLRINGLDSQTCLECHSIVSAATIPFTFGVGGVGGFSQSAFPGVVNLDIDDSEHNGYARIDGRLINPPFNFGVGGVELLAHEMTVDLQALRAAAQATPDTDVPLVTKGVDFGVIRFDSASGEFDISGVQGIGEDLVVRPFGRKGCCATVRAFDLDALPFHLGMQPVELVGEGVDADDDGVVNEVLPGEVSALHLFQVTLDAPMQMPLGTEEQAGQALFLGAGCADCHKPSMQTNSSLLPLAFPEVHTDPTQNVYRTVDLSQVPGFAPAPGGGVIVPFYADLKLHDMGDDLAEAPNSGHGVFRARLAGATPPGQGNKGGGQGHGPGATVDAGRFFTTARLWGLADTAPYLHDGRATTITQAIQFHGGEAQAAADAFAAMTDTQKTQLLAFLRTLRTPTAPAADLP